MMILGGTFRAIAGLAALLDDDYFLVTENGLLVSGSYTAWGWVHLVVGVVVLAAGLAVMAGQMWARIVGVLLAGVSAIAASVAAAVRDGLECGREERSHNPASPSMRNRASHL